MSMRPFRPISTPLSGRLFRDFGRDRDGGIAVTVAAMTAVLVGVLAIAMDLGRAYGLNTKFDNTAGAYALAGATLLDQTRGTFVRAKRPQLTNNSWNIDWTPTLLQNSDPRISHGSLHPRCS
jgi:Flp pilus assembly protein TadG